MSADIEKYFSAFLKSQRAINDFNIKYFPFSVIDELESQNVLVSTLSDYIRWNSKSHLKVEDARCFYTPESDSYLIVYNENKPVNRIRFSLAHELGHILMRHLNNELTEICRGGVGGVEYCIMEGEANTFAGNFLVPPILVKTLIKDFEFDKLWISEIFQVSELSMEYRSRDYNLWLNWKPTTDECRLLARCKATLYPSHCRDCEELFFIEGARFCIFCRGKNLIHYKRYDMKYKETPLAENGKTITCMTCENENILEDGDFCQICGKHVINRCAQEGNNDFYYQCTDADGKHLPSNARYCPYCGAKTTFFRDGILKPWDEEILQEELPF